MLCPVCDTNVVTPPLHRYSATEAAAHFCPPSRNADRFERLQRVVQRLWGGDASEVYVCQACGFGFGWPHVGGDEEYYGILHEQAAYPSDRWEYGLTISRVLQRFPQGGQILDVGTGDGSFLKKLPPSWTRFATEGSDITRTRLRRDSIECFDSTADAVAKAEGSFTVVTMFQVLEHVAAFRHLLADCFQLLRPGGAITISVPLASAMFAQERLTGCQDMTPNHINKWAPDSLSLALGHAGFLPEAAVIEPDSLAAAGYRAGLMTRAQASSRPSSLAARAYTIRSRPLRLGILAALSAVNLACSLRTLPQLTMGGSFLMVGRKPGGDNARQGDAPNKAA